jgi:hypothetical protein
MADVIIYPSGTTGNSSPHIVYEGASAADSIQINMVAPGDVKFSATTSPSLVVFSNNDITTTGVTISSSPSGLWVGGQNMINNAGVWIGPQTTIKGAQ